MGSADGLYALASLDGAPLAMRDRLALGLPADTDAPVLVRARDGGAPATIGPPAFLGHLDEPDALAAELGLDRATPPARLLCAALARFGDVTPARVPGEWSWLDWDGMTLTLMASDTLRDRLLFATDGRRVAVAPHVAALARLDWVERRPDSANLLRHMGRAPLRTTIGDRTMLGGVRRVEAGTCVRIARGRTWASTRLPLPEPVPWTGGFAEAVEALEAVLRHSLRALMVRHPASAVLLSGGLDSSLLAVFAAAERGAGSLVALTSVAPPDSGLPDEAGFARMVADQAGIAMRPVVPGPDADPYRPGDAMLRWMQHPLASPRHYLYDALYREAREAGADAVLDGSEGEWSLTAYPDGLGPRQRVRDWLGGLGARMRAPSVHDAFQVRLSAPALAVAAHELGPAMRLPPSRFVHRRGGPWGYSPSIEQTLGQTTTTPLPEVRRLLPLRDRRLLTMFAGMPYRFVTEGGLARAPGRALLAGKVPDAVRLRTRGAPFSPDYPYRMRRHAARTRAYLADYVRAGVGEWLDLAWLDTALGVIATRDDVPLDLLFQAQATAMTAAFLTHWLEDDARLDIRA